MHMSGQSREKHQTATKYQKLSEAEKKRYKKLNPQDFEEDMSVSKKTLLGG